jgi:hypothetical protein
MRSLWLGVVFFLFALLAPAGAFAAPVNSTAPALSGDGGQTGSTLTVDPGTWSGSPSFSYQWQRCDDNEQCVDIVGATSVLYVAASADAASYLQALVTATDGTGSTSATAVESRGSGSPRPTSNPDWADSGGDIGEELHTANGWIGQRPIVVSYHWGHCPTSGGCAAPDPVPNGSGAIYVTTPADFGTEMAVYVEATNASGTWAATTVAPWLWGSPRVIPSANGDPWGILAVDHYYVGDPLPLILPTWKPSTIVPQYQWERCELINGTCTPIPGATYLDYRPTSADVDNSLQLDITLTNSLGTDVENAWSGIIEANPNPPAPPSPPPAAGSPPAPVPPAIAPTTVPKLKPVPVETPAAPQVPPTAPKPLAKPKAKAKAKAKAKVKAKAKPKPAPKKQKKR